MNNITYREININELDVKLFSRFNRHQDVKKCWRKIDGEWVLRNIAFVEEWDEEDFEYLVNCLKNTIKTGGSVHAAFKDDFLIGFASLENDFFGSANQYLELSCIHTSYESRGLGIGKILFNLIAEEGRKRNAKKLYISTHSSEESQAFYKKLGCIEAKEYNQKAVEKEPCDCQLEYVL